MSNINLHRIVSEFKNYAKMLKENNDLNIKITTLMEDNNFIVYYLVHVDQELISRYIDTAKLFDGGYYIIQFSFREYPLYAPIIRVLTPTGVYKTNMAICVTLSHYHEYDDIIGSTSYQPGDDLIHIMYKFLNNMFSLYKDDHDGIGHNLLSEEKIKNIASNSLKYIQNNKKLNNIYLQIMNNNISYNINEEK